jgi:excinuclease Cho
LDNESVEAHGQRLLRNLERLRVACWLYPGAIGVIECYEVAGCKDALAEENCQIHVIYNWCYLGSVSDLTKARDLSAMAAGLDADGYKILCRPILSGSKKHWHP